MICHFNLDTFEKLKNCSMNEKEAVAPAFIRVQQPLPLGSLSERQPPALLVE